MYRRLTGPPPPVAAVPTPWLERSLAHTPYLRELSILKICEPV
jgi:hypothetical protein